MYKGEKWNPTLFLTKNVPYSIYRCSLILEQSGCFVST